MKVDWDKIISENHKPSRVSRRLAKMVGGNVGVTIGNVLLDIVLPGGRQIIEHSWSMDERMRNRRRGLWQTPEQMEAEMAANRARQEYLDSLPKEPLYIAAWKDYNDYYMKATGKLGRTNEAKKFKALRDETARILLEDYGVDIRDEVGYIFNPREDLPKVDPKVEAAKEAKEQEAERKLAIANNNLALLLRNDRNRKADAARLLAKNQATAAQNAARVQASQQSATSLQEELARVQAAAAASAATRAQNLQSLHALATQKAATSAAEAQQQRAIQAHSAQILAQQNAEVARLREEAMAKQAQVRATPVVPAKVSRRGTAPQVKFGGSKASGYIQKLIAMYKDGLEVFDVKKMKWASDNLRALGIMIEELDNPPAVFPMGRNGLKENREGMVERKMNYSEFLIEPPLKQGKDAATLYKAIYDGKNMRIGKIAHNWLKGGIANNNWMSGSPIKFTGYVDAGKTYTKYYRHKKGSDKGSIPLLTPEEYFKDAPDRLKQLDDYMKSNYFKEHLARLPKEFTAPPTASVEKKVNTADEDALIRILSAKMPELLPNFRNLRVYSRYSYRMRNYRDIIVTNPDPKKWRFFHVLSLGKDLQEVIASSDREGEVKLPEEVVELITDSILTMVPFPKDNDPNDPTVGYYLGSLFVMNKEDFEKKVAAALAKAPQ
jgi:hypothetical protein